MRVGVHGRKRGLRRQYLMVMGVIFCIVSVFMMRTVSGSETRKQQIDNIRQLEEQTMKLTGQIMCEHYLSNAGITMTQICTGAEWKYEILVHHARIGKLSDNQVEEMKLSLYQQMKKIWSAESAVDIQINEMTNDSFCIILIK